MPDIHRVEAVDILRRIERHHHLPRVDTMRQRQLDEDAVDPVVAIEPGDQLKDCRGYPHFGTGACLVANIDLARRIVADQDRGKTGSDLVTFAQEGGRLGDALPQIGGDRPAVDDGGLGHRQLSRR